jgi:hypothetical protein
VSSANFYAVRDDIAEILRFSVDDLGLELRESYSELNEPLRQFASPDDAIEALGLGVDRWGRGDSTQLALWAPRLGPGQLERRQLSVEGRPIREEFEGWGVIAMFVGGVHGRAITPSRFSVNSEKRARLWDDTYAYRLGAADAWDWAEVEAVSRKLRYHVAQRLAAGKTQPPVVHYVLKRAHELCSSGYRLIDGALRPVEYGRAGSGSE